jgi:hypothetical protein
LATVPQGFFTFSPGLSPAEVFLLRANGALEHQYTVLVVERYRVPESQYVVSEDAVHFLANFGLQRPQAARQYLRVA